MAIASSSSATINQKRGTGTAVRVVATFSEREKESDGGGWITVAAGFFKIKDGDTIYPPSNLPSSGAIRYRLKFPQKIRSFGWPHGKKPPSRVSLLRENLNDTCEVLHQLGKNAPVASELFPSLAISAGR